MEHSSHDGTHSRTPFPEPTHKGSHDPDEKPWMFQRCANLQTLDDPLFAFDTQSCNCALNDGRSPVWSKHFWNGVITYGNRHGEIIHWRLSAKWRETANVQRTFLTSGKELTAYRYAPRRIKKKCHWDRRQTNIFPIPKGSIIPPTDACTDKVKFVTILVHRGELPSVQRKENTIDIFGQIDHRDNESTRRRSA